MQVNSIVTRLKQTLKEWSVQGSNLRPPVYRTFSTRPFHRGNDNAKRENPAFSTRKAAKHGFQTTTERQSSVWGAK